MAGIINWGFFSSSLTSTSDTFVANASVFGKVYFLRLVMPLTTIIAGLIRFVIQYVIFLVFFFAERSHCFISGGVSSIYGTGKV